VRDLDRSSMCRVASRDEEEYGAGLLEQGWVLDCGRLKRQPIT
jgi:hypothetical protein